MKDQANSTEKKLVDGYLLVDKPKGKTAFHLVAVLRRRLGVKKIGHAGTLDPLATGVMVMLIGKFTKMSDKLLSQRKTYKATLHLGIETDSYDAEGQQIATSPLEPTESQIIEAIEKFQGDIEQIPPMFSAKKINGQKLYHLARQGKTVERKPALVNIKIDFLNYNYPFVEIDVDCSKGTYIRSLAYDIGKELGCGAHLATLLRTSSGPFDLKDCISSDQLYDDKLDLTPFVKQAIPS